MKNVPPESGMRPMLMKAGTKVAESAAIRGRTPPRTKAQPGGRSVDRGDHRLLERPHGEHVRVIAPAKAVGDVAGASRTRSGLTDAEAAAGARDDNCPNLRVAPSLSAAATRRASPC